MPQRPDAAALGRRLCLPGVRPVPGLERGADADNLPTLRARDAGHRRTLLHRNRRARASRWRGRGRSSVDIASFNAFSKRDAKAAGTAIAAVGRVDSSKWSPLAYALYKVARGRGMDVKVPRKYDF